MSEATLTYDLSNTEDREEFYRATRATDMASCLFNIQNILRRYNKRELTDEQYVVMDSLSREIWEIYNDHDIDLDKLIT